MHAVLLAADVPGDPNYGLEFRDQPVLAADVVRFAGEPVAIVAAESPELAARALELIEVDYEVREPITDMERALAPDAPKLHGWGNVVRHLRIEQAIPRSTRTSGSRGTTRRPRRIRRRSARKGASPCPPRTAGSSST